METEASQHNIQLTETTSASDQTEGIITVQTPNGRILTMEEIDNIPVSPMMYLNAVPEYDLEDTPIIIPTTQVEANTDPRITPSYSFLDFCQEHAIPLESVSEIPLWRKTPNAIHEEEERNEAEIETILNALDTTELLTPIDDECSSALMDTQETPAETPVPDTDEEEDIDILAEMLGMNQPECQTWLTIDSVGTTENIEEITPPEDFNIDLSLFI
jgi:hypothetical protein